MNLDTGREVFYFTKGGPAYAGYHFHEESNPLHTHTFVEIAFAIGGCGSGRASGTASAPASEA